MKNNINEVINIQQRKVWVYKYPIDMRNQIDGLCTIVSSKMNLNPQSGDIFVFFGYAQDKVKLLFWDYTGFVMVYKRLEVGTFVFDKFNNKNIIITRQQLLSILRV